LNGFNIISVRDNLNYLINDSTNNPISSYDQEIYNIYNMDFCNIDLSQVKLQTSFKFIYMITDKYTGNFDLVCSDLLSTEDTSSLYLTKNNKIFSHYPVPLKYEILPYGPKYKFFNNYEDDPYSEECIFNNSITFNNGYNNDLRIYLKNIYVNRLNNLNGSFNGINIKNARS